MMINHNNDEIAINKEVNESSESSESTVTSTGKEDYIQVIVNCNKNDKYEKELNEIGSIKYELPMIDAYVLEIPKHYMGRLRKMRGVIKVEHDTHLTAQMNVARKTVNAVWTDNKRLKGRGVSVAVLDTGIYPHNDFVGRRNRLIQFKDFVNSKEECYDDNGHGTHVAGILGGDGYESKGKYVGIAPECNIIGVKVLNEKGSGNISDVLAGIQWVIHNKNKLNIRVINLSVGTDDIEGEDAALVRGVNAAWDAGLVVVAAAGNNGPKKGTITTPGISRKIITVGSSDDAETVDIFGDYITNYSGRGPTKACIKKPDVVAPGSNITSCKADTTYAPSKRYYPSNYLGYICKSGTSMATPIVSGAIALLLSLKPQLTNKEIKLKLMDSVNDLGFPQSRQGWGRIDLQKFLN